MGDPDQIVHVGTYKSECYHDPGCSRLNAARPEEMTLSEAEDKGYRPCPDFGGERDLGHTEDASFTNDTIAALQELGYAEGKDGQQQSG